MHQTKKIFIEPLVSVVINCYNGEKYLKQSIESLLLQTYKKWELIFWDNKSTDGSSDIILSYNDKRIKYYCSDVHTTLYQARNLALRKCRGDFISFLDVDDYYLKNKISKQLLYFNDAKVGVVYSNYYRYYENIKKKIVLTKNKLPSGNLTQHILEDSQISFMTVMIRKKSLYLLNYIFNPKYSIIGDYDLLYRLSLNWNFSYIKDPLAVYRIHNNNFSKNSHLFISELQDWYDKNYNSFVKKKNYVYKKIIYLKSLDYIYKKNILGFLVEFNKYPMSFNKIKLLLLIIIPNFILNLLKTLKR